LKDACYRTADAKALVETMSSTVASLVANGSVDPATVATFLSFAGSPIATPQPIAAPTIQTPSAQAKSLPVVSSARGGREGLDGRKLVLGILVGTFGVAGAVAMVALIFKGGTPNLPAVARDGGVPLIALSGSSSATTAPPLTPDERVVEAQKLLAKGDYASAVETLKGADSATKRLELHQLRVQANTKLERWSEAMRDAQELLSIHPEEADEVPFRTSVRDAAISSDKEGSELAFGLLEKSMGQAGLVDLFELGYGAAADAYPQAAQRSQQILGKAEVRAKMPPALAVNLDILRAGKTCALKRHFEKAVSDGDKRTLALLRAIRLDAKPTGGKKDPLACIRDDLPKTLTKLAERVK